MEVKQLKHLLALQQKELEVLRMYRSLLASPDSQINILRIRTVLNYREAWEEYKAREVVIAAIVASMPSDLLRDIMEARYIGGLSWADISQSVHFSEGYLYTLHNKALEVAASSYAG